MLKTLELLGFKSFADRTEFEFSAGITGVVGPNGSGKSNVVDAIKWILGDQSARSLRGKDMTDVIFNGSASRGGAQFAEATLVFDNSSRFLPLEADEVSVGRRLWKSGDSEYLLNRNTARLKDIRELFSGTGAGASAYCIIEQGRVDQILQSNAANRRLIFEEAAGISRFRGRKVEAERRLDRVEQNLLRLTDIVEEVETQVTSLRSQAEKATKFRELSSELETLWIGLAADDYRRQSAIRESVEKQLNAGLSELREHRAEQQRVAAKLAAADEELRAADHELRAAERQRAEIQSRMASLTTSARHETERETELTTELDRLRRQMAVMDGRVREAQDELAELESASSQESERVAACRHKCSECEERITELQQSHNSVRSQIEATRSEYHHQSAVCQELTAELGALQVRRQSLEQRHSELEETRSGVMQTVSDLRARMREFESAADTALQNLRLAEDNADGVLSSRDTLVRRQSESRESLGQLREQRSAATARRGVLEDLEDRQEGFGIGVREILRRAEETDQEPWNLIRGSVADLLDVDMQNAALLEVALAGRAQLLVTDRMQPVIDYLNSGSCRINGRVGFVSLEDGDPQILTTPSAPTTAEPISAPPPNAADVPTVSDLSIMPAEDSDESLFGDDWLTQPGVSSSAQLGHNLSVAWMEPDSSRPVVRSVFTDEELTVESLEGRPGVVGRADGLARSPANAPGLAALLLADTWIVRSLDDGLRLRRDLGGAYRFVTLQGELIERDRTLHTGVLRSESAVLSRKSELRRLRSELHRIEHEITERTLRLDALVSTIASTDEQLLTIQAAVDAANAEHRSRVRELEQHTQSLKHNEDSAAEIRRQLDDLVGLIATVDEQIADTRQRRSDARNTIDEVQSRVRAFETSLQESADTLTGMRSEAHEFRLELTRSEERQLAADDAVQRLRDDLQQRVTQQQEAERRLRTGLSRVGRLRLIRLNLSAESHELSWARDRQSEQIRRLSVRQQQLVEVRRDVGAQEQKYQDLCRRLEASGHESELRLKAIDHQLQTTAERIRDEYGVEVADAAASGKSAFEIWQSSGHEGESRPQDTASAPDSTDEMLRADNDSGRTRFSGESDGTDDGSDDDIGSSPIPNDEEWASLRPKIEERIASLKRRLRKVGHVGVESLANLDELEERFERLRSQLSDLQAARDALRELVRRINTESRRMFTETFESIRGHFRELFRKLFGGGEADLVLDDPEDVLECAIDVVARPPGKELRSISLLSGGEKTMTAVALLLSIFRSRPSPFCILDEVDAALDDANIGRFVGVLKEFQHDTQFIMITHRKPTMAVTDVLYGVTMQESGVSRRLSVRFEEIDDQGNFIDRTGSGRSAA